MQTPLNALPLVISEVIILVYGQLLENKFMDPSFKQLRWLNALSREGFFAFRLSLNFACRQLGLWFLELLLLIARRLLF